MRQRTNFTLLDNTSSRRRMLPYVQCTWQWQWQWELLKQSIPACMVVDSNVSNWLPIQSVMLKFDKQLHCRPIFNIWVQNYTQDLFHISIFKYKYIAIFDSKYISHVLHFVWFNYDSYIHTDVSIVVQVYRGWNFVSKCISQGAQLKPN